MRILKQLGMELKHDNPVIPEINSFITTEITRLEQLVGQQERRKNEIEPLNVLFREMVG